MIGALSNDEALKISMKVSLFVLKYKVSTRILDKATRLYIFNKTPYILPAL